MKCPFCNNKSSKVVDSRDYSGGYKIKRRRECLSCKRRFTTYETVEHIPIYVIKRDSTREEFSKETEKLKESVTLSYKDGKVVSATMTVDNINLKSNKKEMFSKLEELVKMLEPSFGENVSKSLKTTLKNFPKESFSSPIVSDDFFVRTTNNSKIYSISTGKILPKKN